MKNFSLESLNQILEDSSNDDQQPFTVYAWNRVYAIVPKGGIPLLSFCTLFLIIKQTKDRTLSTLLLSIPNVLWIGVFSLLIYSAWFFRKQALDADRIRSVDPSYDLDYPFIFTQLGVLGVSLLVLSFLYWKTRKTLRKDLFDKIK